MKRSISSEDRRSPPPRFRQSSVESDDQRKSSERQNTQQSGNGDVRPRMKSRESVSSEETLTYSPSHKEDWQSLLSDDDHDEISREISRQGKKEPESDDEISSEDSKSLSGTDGDIFDFTKRIIHKRGEILIEKSEDIINYLSDNESDENNISQAHRYGRLRNVCQYKNTLSVGIIPLDHIEHFREQLQQNTTINKIIIEDLDYQSGHDYEKYGPGENIILPMILEIVCEKDNIKSLVLNGLTKGSLRDVKKEFLKLADRITSLQIQCANLGGDFEILLELLALNKTIQSLTLDLPVKDEEKLRFANVINSNKTITELHLLSWKSGSIDGDLAETEKSIDTPVVPDALSQHFFSLLEKNSTLTTLNISSHIDNVNQAYTKDKQALIGLISKKTAIKNLTASDFGWSDKDVVSLFEALKKNTSLTHLDIFRDGSNRRTYSYQAIAVGLEENNTLQSIYLPKYFFSDQGFRSLAEILQKNTTLLEINGSSSNWRLSYPIGFFLFPTAQDLLQAGGETPPIPRDLQAERAVMIGLSRNRLLPQVRDAGMGATMMLGFRVRQPNPLPWLPQDITQQIARAVIDHLPENQAEHVLGAMALNDLTST